MLNILAQSSRGGANFFDNMSNIFSRPDTLAHPEALIEALGAMSVVWSIIFLAAGLVCLLQGYRFYRTVTVVLALAIGLFAGYNLGKKINAEYIVAGSLSLLLAVGCFPLMKYAVAVMGGVVGSFVGANAWTALTQLLTEDPTAGNHYWVGALMGLMVGGMLAFILFQLSIVMFTSVSGSTVAVLGGVGLLLQFDVFRTTVSDSISANAAIMPLLVIVPAVIGFILQEHHAYYYGDEETKGESA